jgi:hypothetical protein
MGGASSRPSLELLADNANKVRALPDLILNSLFAQAKFQDILMTQSKGGCASFVYLTKNALQTLFQELKVEPKQGDAIYFASVADLTLAKKDTDPQLIKLRNENCYRVGFFYVRLFQIFGALAFSIMDTYPARTFGARASFGALGAPVGQKRPAKILGGGARGRTTRRQHGGAAPGTQQVKGKLGSFIRSKMPGFFFDSFIRTQIIGSKPYTVFVNPFSSSLPQGVKEFLYLNEEIDESDELIAVAETDKVFQCNYYLQYTPQGSRERVVVEKPVIITYTVAQEDSKLRATLSVDDTPVAVFEGEKDRFGAFTWTSSMNEKRVMMEVYLKVRETHAPGIFPATAGISTFGTAPLGAPAAPFVVQPTAAGLGATSTSGITAPQQLGATQFRPGTGPAQFAAANVKDSFVGLAEVHQRLIKDKTFPKAYAIGRAMMLLNPTLPQEATKYTQFSSDICRDRSSALNFETRAPSMPVPGSMTQANVYFRSLVALYYDAYSVNDQGGMILTQTPPGYLALNQASDLMGKMFHLDSAKQASFLISSHQIPFPPVCKSGTQNIPSKIELRPPTDKAKQKDYATLISKLRGKISELIALQDSHNKQVTKLLESMFGSLKAKKIALNPAIYKGGIPKVNELARVARSLLLNYYLKAEAIYTEGVELMMEARNAGLLTYVAQTASASTTGLGGLGGLGALPPLGFGTGLAGQGLGGVPLAQLMKS